MDIDKAIDFIYQKAHEENIKASELAKNRQNEAFTHLTQSEDWVQIADWLTELSKRREVDRWISVDEALPEKEGWYLVDRKERTFSIQYFFFGTVDHTPYWSGECKVYYWRPLPKAPESEEK